jgi:hypothetical protein
MKARLGFKEEKKKRREEIWRIEEMRFKVQGREEKRT